MHTVFIVLSLALCASSALAAWVPDRDTRELTSDPIDKVDRDVAMMDKEEVLHDMPESEVRAKRWFGYGLGWGGLGWGGYGLGYGYPFGLGLGYGLWGKRDASMMNEEIKPVMKVKRDISEPIMHDEKLPEMKEDAKLDRQRRWFGYGLGWGGLGWGGYGLGFGYPFGLGYGLWGKRNTESQMPTKRLNAMVDSTVPMTGDMASQPIVSSPVSSPIVSRPIVKRQWPSRGSNFNNNNSGGGSRGNNFNNNNSGGGRGNNFNNNNSGGGGRGNNFNNNNSGGGGRGDNFNNNNSGGSRWSDNFNNNNGR